MEKEIDRLLQILNKQPDGRLLKQIIDDKEIDISIIKNAKNLGYVKYYNEEMKDYTDIFHGNNYCRITDQGSQMLYMYGGLKRFINRNKINLIISITAIAIALLSLIVSLLK